MDILIPIFTFDLFRETDDTFAREIRNITLKGESNFAQEYQYEEPVQEAQMHLHHHLVETKPKSVAAALVKSHKYSASHETETSSFEQQQYSEQRAPVPERFDRE